MLLKILTPQEIKACLKWTEIVVTHEDLTSLLRCIVIFSKIYAPHNYYRRIIASVV